MGSDSERLVDLSGDARRFSVPGSRQHAAAHGLVARGKELRSVARELGLARNTIHHLAHARGPAELPIGQWTATRSTSASMSSIATSPAWRLHETRRSTSSTASRNRGFGDSVRFRAGSGVCPAAFGVTRGMHGRGGLAQAQRALVRRLYALFRHARRSCRRSHSFSTVMCRW